MSYVLCSSCRGRCDRSLAPRQSNISSRDHQPRRLSSATRKRIYSPANSARQGRHRTRQCDLTFALSQICAPDICFPPERKPTIADIRRWLGLKFRVMGLVFRVTVRVWVRITQGKTSAMVIFWWHVFGGTANVLHSGGSRWAGGRSFLPGRIDRLGVVVASPAAGAGFPRRARSVGRRD